MVQILEKREWNYSHQSNSLPLDQNCPWLNLQDGGRFKMNFVMATNCNFNMICRKTIGRLCFRCDKASCGIVQTKANENIPNQLWYPFETIFSIHFKTSCWSSRHNWYCLIYNCCFDYHLLNYRFTGSLRNLKTSKLRYTTQNKRTLKEKFRPGDESKIRTSEGE